MSQHRLSAPRCSSWTNMATCIAATMTIGTLSSERKRKTKIFVCGHSSCDISTTRANSWSSLIALNRWLSGGFATLIVVD